MSTSVKRANIENAVNFIKSAAVSPVRELRYLRIYRADSARKIFSNGVKQNFFLPLVIFFISCLGALNLFAASEQSIKKLYGDYLKGLFYAEEGSFEQALTELNKVKKVDPNSIYVRLKIASVLIRMGALEKAEAELKEAKALNPESFDASLGLIFLYSYGQKDVELEGEYEEFLKKAHKLKPGDVKISEYLAQFYFYKKQPQEALAIYENIVKQQPEYVDALFWLGFLYEDLKRRDDAIKTWKKALQISPNHSQTLNSLGYLYAEEGKNLDEAESMLKKALEAEPDNGAYLDSIGWIYFKKKDYKKAQDYLKKAIKYQEDPVIYEHMGDLYIALSKKEDALDFYKKGLERFPDNKELKNKVDRYGAENKVPKK
ncbi:MAG: tetratricopeptide repeat protein [Candidatus Omnitrophica bacterium]|jgi:tetratricopeptide (TPR) repeat protein|nr:tetratricopeptide repeat protein [Candidatus Omnitrophota bacterium]